MERISENTVDRALRESEREYRRMAERFPNGILVHVAGRVVFANAACARMLGARTAEDLAGVEIAQLADPSQRASLLARQPDATTRPDAGTFARARLLRLDGSALDADVASSAVYYEGLEATETILHAVAPAGPEGPDLDAPGRIVALIEPAEPAAIRRAAEPVEPDTERAALEARIADLTAARDEALHAAEIKNRFLARVGDEIRTPMNGIMGMTDLLIETTLDDVQRDGVETIRTSADALLEIITDVLDYSKLEAGRMRLDAIDFDLRTTVENVVGPHREQALAKGLDIVCLVQPDVPETVHGDPGRLRQVLANLLENAVAFTDSGEITVGVSVAEETAERVHVRFSVSDTGIGVPDDARDRIFLPFSNGEPPVTGRTGGTGLGLPICRGLVTLMQGTIEVESEIGRGSVFTFVVPSPKRAAPRPEAPRRVGVEGLRALVVSDADATRSGLSELFGAWGIVVATSEGASAIDALRAAGERGEPFEVAIINFVQAESDPIALGRSIGQAFGPKAPALLLIASAARPGDGARAHEAGFGAFLTKPIPPALLREGIAAIVVARPSAGAPAPALVTRHSLAEERARRLARILVVDDDAVSQKVAVRQLEKMGHRADVAAGGEEAVGAVQRVAYDVVLMDCKMPGQDGFQTTRAIRGLDGDPGKVPIIALTADAFSVTEDHWREAGMNGFITKPVSADDLAATLARYLPEPEPEEGEAEPPLATRGVSAGVTLHAVKPKSKPPADAPSLDSAETAG
jgi:PAS domain S-box-containing protein